jgi:hypothetical protein
VRVALDLDGVLFDFVKAMHMLIPIIPPQPKEANLFLYVKDRPADVNLFNTLIGSPDFYYGLPLMDGVEELIPYLNQYDTYVVSARPKAVHIKSMVRLYELGLRPVDVIWTHKKGNTVHDLKLDVMVDDQEKYAKQVSNEVPIFMPVRSYNEDFINTSEQSITPYHTIPQLIRLLEGEGI